MADKGGGVKSFIGIVIMMVLIAAGTSYGFMTYFDRTNSQHVLESKDIGPTYSLGDFIVNLSGTGGYQYIKASIVVEVSQDSVIRELDKRSPQIRDIIISILRDQKMADIEEPGARTIKNRVRAELNQVLTTGKITSVWFTQLVVQ
ncbi:flagellar basal body-associated FliL family protein [Halothermothrix orenii]|uniref:Flagellar protein FliL n=1 Tax=Halothermothrix orenii (strain H 168 / OCM 544 / DSM 9562) TaxID=373903 RepID=B8CYQ7_HALOH|nr:flagellar basal body-associated FliL family protein [Halothermothrix orenii]ACL70426.1 flagellar basal body-associated protein FliL [Halothermothrix orenii H 168]